MDIQTAKTSLGYISSGLLLTTGIRAILDPKAISQTYGIPAEDTTSSYVPAMGVRTFAIGLSVGALLFQGQTRAAGTVLSTALLVGPLDTWIVYRHTGKVTSAVVNHIVGDGLAGALGLWFLA